MTTDPQPERKSSPALAKTITVVLVALAVYSELKTDHVDSTLLGGVIVLVLFWAGQGIDRIFPFR